MPTALRRFSLYCITLSLLLTAINVKGQNAKLKMFTTTINKSWCVSYPHEINSRHKNPDLKIDPKTTLQTVLGFGGCFNELGWTSLQQLSRKDQQLIFKELFSPGYGLNFNLCRMPVGANDFSLNWYSYDETDGDFEMKDFSIERDKKALIPYIKKALSFYPALSIWASPWSPPSWLKYNHHYACQVDNYPLNSPFHNGLNENQQGKEGTDMFIQKDRYLAAYAKYLSLFVKAYKREQISISTLMPQNEFNSSQIFPSCVWKSTSLANFIGGYLGPALKDTRTEIMFGTLERENPSFVDTIMQDNRNISFVKGVGFQWAGKSSVAIVHTNYPHLKLYQTEQECGDGKNDWSYCNYTWELMKQYFKSGVNAYMYWNIALMKGGVSRWGWRQNSLITVDTISHTFNYNYEFYLFKHLSHFVKPGARLLAVADSNADELSFINPDNTIIILCRNINASKQTIHISISRRLFVATLKPQSFNTIVVKQ